VPKERPRGSSAEKPEEKPEAKPEPKPEEKKTPVSPTSGESEEAEWRGSVLRKLDALTEKVTAQGKAIQEWGTEPEEKPEEKPEQKPKAESMSAPPEPLDEFSNRA
jgi:hypothetical protein